MPEQDRRRLDPRTAAAYWDYGCFGDPDGEHSIGRQTFWWDPTNPQETISHCDMYEAWPELSDIDWRRLTHIAHARDGVHLASRELEKALAELKNAEHDAATRPEQLPQYPPSPFIGSWEEAP